MTEDEWFLEPDFTRHVKFVESRLSPRKRRLLAAALCRSVGHLHADVAIHRTVEAAEEFADGNCTVAELERLGLQCRETAVRANEEWKRWVEINPGESLKWWLLYELAWAAAYTATTSVPVAVIEVGMRAREATVRARTGDSGVIQLKHLLQTQTAPAEVHNHEFRALVWDLAGNPFSPVEFPPDWRTSTAVAVANHTYQSRDFAAMPILADALQDAGCNDELMLNHCRNPGVHARGCWVVDAVLEKA